MNDTIMNQKLNLFSKLMKIFKNARFNFSGSIHDDGVSLTVFNETLKT